MVVGHLETSNIYKNWSTGKTFLTYLQTNHFEMKFELYHLHLYCFSLETCSIEYEAQIQVHESDRNIYDLVETYQEF